MTLILAVTAPESIWLMADRRLSFGRNEHGNPRRTPRDDACKITVEETADGVALIGYAGLGLTAAGTEPANWMSNVFRGRHPPLVEALGLLASAAARELPPHLDALPRDFARSHHILIPAFVRNEPRLYAIDVKKNAAGTGYRCDYKDLRFRRSGKSLRFGIAGSGADYLVKHKKWERPILDVVRAVDEKRLSAGDAAQRFAALNHEVHLNLPDGSVGSRCVVVWRFRDGGVHGVRGGGGEASFSATQPEQPSTGLPVVGNGMDLNAIVRATMRCITLIPGQKIDVDVDALNAELAKLPSDPDERLR